MDDTRYTVKRNLTLPILVSVIFLGIAAAGVYFFLTSYTVTADRILIAVEVPEAEGGDGQWWGKQGESSVRFIRGIKKSLEAVGFKVVLPNDKEVLATMKGATGREGLIEKARALGAGVLIDGRLDVTREAVLGEGKAVEVMIEGEINILLTDQDGAEVKTIPVRQLQVGPDRADAIRLAASGASELLFDEIVAAIITIPEVDKIFDKTTRTPEQAQVANAIKRAYNFVDSRTVEIQKRDQIVANAEERWKAQGAGPVPIKQLSPFGREDYLVGVLPGASGVISTVKERSTFMDLESFKLKSSWLPERQDLIGLDGASHMVFEAYNIFSYPGLSSNGKVLAVVTEEHGLGFSLRVVTIDPATGQPSDRKILLTVPTPWRLSYPVVSPDGTKLLFNSRTCPRCNSSLEVIGIDGQNRAFVFKADDWRGVGDAQWVGAKGDKVAYVLHHDERPRRFFTVGLAEKTPTLVHVNSDEEGAYINEEFSPDGTKLAFVKGGPEGRQLVVRDMATDELKVLTTNIYVKRPAFSFDNKWVAFEATGKASPKDRYYRDHEIAVVSTEGEPQIKYMTVNDFKDRHLKWAPDKHDIYFETVYEDPQSGAPWVAIRSLSISP